MGGNVGVYVRPHLCPSILYFSPLLMLPCVWLVGFAPLSVWGPQHWHQQLHMLCVVHLRCLVLHLVCKDVTRPRVLSPFKFLCLGVKGGVITLLSPWWWAASGSSSFSSSFSVVGNKMSPGLSRSTVLGVRIPLPQVSAVL